MYYKLNVYMKTEGRPLSMEARFRHKYINKGNCDFISQF